MAESMLPPLILELRGRASQLFAEMSAARKDVAATAAATEASAATIESSATKVADSWGKASASMRAQVLSASSAVDTASLRVNAAREHAATAAQRVSAAEKELADAIAAEGATSDRAVAAQTALAEAQNRLEAATVRVTAAESAQEAATARQIAANQKLVASTEKASASSGLLASIGKKAAIGTVGIAALVGYESLKMAGNFQASVNRLETAAGESHQNLKMVGDGIMSIARDTGTSTTQMADGMYMIESAGFHGAKGLEVAKAAAQGAKNEGADLGGVANALTTVMTDLGSKSGTAATEMSQMVAAVGQGKMKMDDLAGSIHSVLPNAAGFGISFAQVAGALATMTAEGVSADQAAQNLNHTIVKLAAPTVAMSNAMAAYGVNSEDLKNHLGKNGLTGTMDILSQAIIGHMGPAGLALMDTFKKNKTAIADVQTMMQNLPASAQEMAQGFLMGTVSAKDMTKEAKSLGAAGSAQVKQFIAQAQAAYGFNDALSHGKSTAQTFNQAMYSMLGDQTGLQVALHLTGDHLQTFKDNVNVVGKATADAHGNVKDWAVTQGNFNTQMGRFKETVATAAIAIGQKLLPVATTVIKFLADHKGVLIAVASVIGGVLVAATLAWVASMATATVTIGTFEMMAAPLIGIILAIMAAVAAIGYGIYEFATHWSQIWSGIKGVASAVWDWMKDAASTVAHAVVDPIMAGVHALAAVWSAVWGAITGVFSAVTGFIHQHSAMIVGFIAIIALPIALVIAAVHFLWTHWQQVWGAITTATKWAYNSVIKPVGDGIVSYVIHPIAAAASWLGGVWSSIWHGVGSAANAVYNSVIRPIGSGISSVFHGIQAALSWLSGVWSALWSGIGNALQSIYDHTIGPIVNTIKGAIGGVQSAVSGIGSVASSVGHYLGFANGGRVPGAPGEPRLAVVHGGEYVLSQDMQTGRQAIDPDVLSNTTNANGYTAASATAGPSATELALTGAAPSAASTGGAPVVNIYAQTNASASRIGGELGWVLRKTA